MTLWTSQELWGERDWESRVEDNHTSETGRTWGQTETRSRIPPSSKPARSADGIPVPSPRPTPLLAIVSHLCCRSWVAQGTTTATLGQTRLFTYKALYIWQSIFTYDFIEKWQEKGRSKWKPDQGKSHLVLSTILSAVSPYLSCLWRTCECSLNLCC